MNNPALKQENLEASLEYEQAADAEERLIAIFEYLLTPQKTLDNSKLL